MTNSRSGRIAFGCLFSVAVIAVILYAAAKFGPPWLAYQRFKDLMRNEARFAISIPDSVIKARLAARADTLGLPVQAQHITIKHSFHPTTVTIFSDYSVEITLILLGKKVLHFHPSVGEAL